MNSSDPGKSQFKPIQETPSNTSPAQTDLPVRKKKPHLTGIETSSQSDTNFVQNRHVKMSVVTFSYSDLTNTQFLFFECHDLTSNQTDKTDENPNSQPSLGKGSAESDA